MRVTYRRRFSLTRACALTLCVVLLLTSQPVAFFRSAASGQNPNQQDKEEKGLRRSTIPDYQLPDLNEVMNEGKKAKRTELPRPPLKPSTDCGFRDDECRANKKAKEKIGQILTPGDTAPANQIASQAAPTPSQPSSQYDAPQTGWRQRLRKWVGALTSLASTPPASTTATGASSFMPSAAMPSAAPSMPAVKAATAAAAYTPPMFLSMKESQTDPHYRMGGDGEDLFSGNYHWSLPLVSLPGRAGLDVNVTLHYNSLTWLKYGSVITFDHDRYASLTPGFRLGFPELDGQFMLRGVSSYILVLPSGRRVVMRNVATNTYEAIDSSNFYLVTAGATATLFSPDGVQYRYTTPGNNGVYRCTKVVNRNGNCLTINYANMGVSPNIQTSISSIVDTLGRTVNFTYDGNFKLLTITQSWAGQTFTWAQFDYMNLTMNTNFTPVNYGPPNGMVIPVIKRIITGDGARHEFVYNSWGQVNELVTYGEADNKRSVMFYAFPSTATPQNDCPLFTQRNDYIANWAGQNGAGWVTTYFYVAPDESYGQIGYPNGVVYKEFHGNLIDHERGLLKRTETYETNAANTLRKFTINLWASDGTAGSFPPIRPRIIETKVCDNRDTNNSYQSGTDKMRRTTISYVQLPNLMYTTIRLPEYIREHNEGDTGSSAYRTRKLSYLSNSDYISSTRRIVGLVAQECLYSGEPSAAALVAQTDYAYDCPADGFTYLQDHTASNGTISQHEGHSSTAAYQTGGQPRRGNLNKTMRYSISSAGAPSAPITYKTGYNSTGTMACSTDGIEAHKTSIFYNDAFTIAVAGAPATPTYAYPTRVQDPDTFSSMVKYHYDHGGVTLAIDPKSYAANPANPPAKTETLYDTKGL